MGVFEVEIKVRNWQNRFLPEEERGEDVTCQALVDSGAVQLSLPVEFVERLKAELSRVLGLRNSNSCEEVHDGRGDDLAGNSKAFRCRMGVDRRPGGHRGATGEAWQGLVAQQG